MGWKMGPVWIFLLSSVLVSTAYAANCTRVNCPQDATCEDLADSNIFTCTIDFNCKEDTDECVCVPCGGCGGCKLADHKCLCAPGLGGENCKSMWTYEMARDPEFSIQAGADDFPTAYSVWACEKACLERTACVYTVYRESGPTCALYNSPGNRGQGTGVFLSTKIKVLLPQSPDPTSPPTLHAGDNPPILRDTSLVVGSKLICRSGPKSKVELYGSAVQNSTAETCEENSKGQCACSVTATFAQEGSVICKATYSDGTEMCAGGNCISGFNIRDVHSVDTDGGDKDDDDDDGDDGDDDDDGGDAGEDDGDNAGEDSEENADEDGEENANGGDKEDGNVEDGDDDNDGDGDANGDNDDDNDGAGSEAAQSGCCVRVMAEAGLITLLVIAASYLNTN